MICLHYYVHLLQNRNLQQFTTSTTPKIPHLPIVTMVAIEAVWDPSSKAGLKTKVQLIKQQYRKKRCTARVENHMGKIPGVSDMSLDDRVRLKDTYIRSTRDDEANRIQEVTQIYKDRRKERKKTGEEVSSGDSESGEEVNRVGEDHQQDDRGEGTAAA